MINPEKEKTKKEFKTGVKAIWRHVQPFKKELWILLGLGLISAATNGFVPYVTGKFFDALIATANHTSSPWVYGLPFWAAMLILWTIIQLIANNVDWIMDRLRRYLDSKVHFTIQTDGFIHLFRLPIGYYKDSHINGILQKLSQAGWRVSAIVRIIVQIAPQFLSVIIGITLAASINHLLAGIMLIGVVLYVALLIKILLPIAAIDSAAHQTWNDSWDDSAAAVMQVESVKQASAESYETEKIQKSLLGKAFALWSRLDRNWSNVAFFQRVIVFLTQLTIFILSVHLIEVGSISIGQLVALNGYAMMFFGPFVSLGYSWQVIQNGITSAAHAEEIFLTPQENYRPEASQPVKKISGRVVFEKVSFTYNTEQKNIIEDFTIDIPAGQIVALVGESGVGKSTLISLLSAYNFPSEGKVLIDGIDSRNLDLTNLRQQIAVVPQEVALFNDTLKANIRYGSFTATDAEVHRAAVEAHLAEYIATLPNGYNTIVGERGVKLSVGQKQRVAIARAILRNPAILILDEPTSALDAKTEQIIIKALEKLMKDRTTFVIAHRLSTVRKADVILVIEKGKIVEQGTHQELLDKPKGAYRRLYEYQIGLH